MLTLHPSPAIVVAGPTASGKSALAVDLAVELGGEVINADSLQIYRGLPILTAQPGAAERAAAPHTLYAALDPTAPCSAGIWRGLAVAAMAAARAAGRRPILCGGTGLYMEALIRGLSPMPPVPAAVRAQAQAHHAALGGAGLRARLADVDPVLAGRLPDGDAQRLTRAWEVWLATGRPLSHWQAAPPDGPPRGEAFKVITLIPPMAALDARGRARFDAMLGAGALAEVGALLDEDVPEDAPVWRALGARELAAHLRGVLDLRAAVDAAVLATRHYAKRQRTWFRNRFDAVRLGPAVHGSHVLSAQYSTSLRDHIRSKLNVHG